MFYGMKGVKDPNFRGSAPSLKSQKNPMSSVRLQRSPSGFTLIEVLIAASLVSLIAFAVYANFDSGIRVMERVNHVMQEEDINVFFEKLSRDIQNSFRYASIPFKGNGEKLSFPSSIATEPVLGSSRGIGRVSYYYNSSQGRIERLQENVSQMFQGEKEVVEPTTALSNISSVRFQYFAYDKKEEAYTWKEEWGDADNRIPLAVKAELVFHDEGIEKTLTRTIAVPVGG